MYNSCSFTFYHVEIMGHSIGAIETVTDEYVHHLYGW